MGDVSLPPLDVQNFVASIPTKSAVSHASVQKPFNQLDICISIVSNSRLLSESLILLLQNHWLMNVVNSGSGDVNIASTSMSPTNHLVLLDSGIGHNAVLTHIRKWRSLQPPPYIVVIELKNDPDLIVDCIEAGAHGYALQSALSIEVIQVIEQVYQGVARCSPEITAKLFARLTQLKAVQQFREKPVLTSRELEVVYYVAKYYSDRDIATKLFIEVRTVKHHVHNILQKLNVKHRRDAAQLAIDNGWLNLTS